MLEENSLPFSALLDVQGEYCPEAAAAKLGITVNTFARELAVDIDALTSNRSPTTQAQQRICALAKTLDRILPRCGSAPEAWEWVTSSPIGSLGDRTAMHLIRIDRGQAVLKHLERLNAGGYG